MIDPEEAIAIYRESIAALAISLAGGLFAGTVLGTDAMIDGFERYPGLMLLLPAFLATRGNVYGALGARISTGLHQGLLEPRFERNERLINAIVASFVNGIGISIVIALISSAIVRLAYDQSPPVVELVAMMLVAGVLTAALMISVLLAILFVGFTRGLDPDNLIGPIVTTLGDVFGVTFLYVALLVVEVVL